MRKINNPEGKNQYSPGGSQVGRALRGSDKKQPRRLKAKPGEMMPYAAELVEDKKIMLKAVTKKAATQPSKQLTTAGALRGAFKSIGNALQTDAGTIKKRVRDAENRRLAAQNQQAKRMAQARVVAAAKKQQDLKNYNAQGAKAAGNAFAKIDAPRKAIIREANMRKAQIVAADRKMTKSMVTTRNRTRGQVNNKINEVNTARKDFDKSVNQTVSNKVTAVNDSVRNKVKEINTSRKNFDKSVNQGVSNRVTAVNDSVRNKVKEINTNRKNFDKSVNDGAAAIFKAARETSSKFKSGLFVLKRTTPPKAAAVKRAAPKKAAVKRTAPKKAVAVKGSATASVAQFNKLLKRKSRL